MLLKELKLEMWRLSRPDRMAAFKEPPSQYSNSINTYT
jgi:hypothetical protein